MRWALLLVLLSMSALARPDRLSVYPRLDRRDRLGAATAPYTVFFSFTDPGNECSGAPLDGVTFSRATSQPCANASMTTTMVAAQQPSIEADGLILAAGTSVFVPSPFRAGTDRVIALTFARTGQMSAAGALANWGTFGSANSAILILVSGYIRYQERDASNAAVTWQSPVLAPGAHAVHLYLPSVGAPVLHVDGAPTAFARTNGLENTRMPSPPASVRLGAVENGTSAFGGRLRDVCLSVNAVDCPVTPLPERAGPVFVAIGDSNTAGSAVASVSAVPYPKRQQWLGGYLSNSVANEGAGGNTAAQALATWTTWVRPSSPDGIVLMAGTNDVNRDAQPASVPWASLKQIIDEAKSDGVTVVVSTVFPTSQISGTPAKQAELEALNTLIRDYAASESLVLVDGYAVVGDPLNPTVLNPAFNSGDNLHVNEAGAAAFAQAVYDALNPPAPLAATGDGDGSLGWFGALAALGVAGAGIYAARRSRA